jgi:hypothetical protein
MANDIDLKQLLELVRIKIENPEEYKRLLKEMEEIFYDMANLTFNVSKRLNE